MKAIPRMIPDAETREFRQEVVKPSEDPILSGYVRRLGRMKAAKAQRQRRVDLRGNDAKGDYIVKLIQQKTTSQHGC